MRLKAVDAHVKAAPRAPRTVLGQVQFAASRAVVGKNATLGSCVPRPHAAADCAEAADFGLERLLTAATVVAVLVIALWARLLWAATVASEQAFSELADLHVATLASANPWTWFPPTGTP